MAERIETQTVDGLRLAVEFYRLADRFGHRLLWLERDVVSTLFDSVEGTATDGWPPSPVLQQLHLEDRAAGRPSAADSARDGRVALMVGMAGRSHWSLSVEPTENAAAVDFDVACRADSSGSIELGSTYKPALAGILQNRQYVVSLRAGWVAVVRAVSDPGSDLNFDARGLIISPRELKVPTSRWKYRIELVSQPISDFR